MDKPLLIAIPVDEVYLIAEQAGRALRWNVYFSEVKGQAQFGWQICLSQAGSLHEWHVRGEGDRHPLHYVDRVIVRSAGLGVVRRLQERDTLVCLTEQKCPEKALHEFLKGQVDTITEQQDLSCDEGKEKSLIAL